MVSQQSMSNASCPTLIRHFHLYCNCHLAHNIVLGHHITCVHTHRKLVDIQKTGLRTWASDPEPRILSLGSRGSDSGTLWFHDLSCYLILLCHVHSNCTVVPTYGISTNRRFLPHTELSSTVIRTWSSRTFSSVLHLSSCTSHSLAYLTGCSTVCRRCWGPNGGGGLNGGGCHRLWWKSTFA